MIEIPTALVLGAGASHDFGFPLGRDLFEEIRDDLKHTSSPLWKSLNEFGFNDNEIINSFRKELRRSDAPSVDAFLETQDDFQDLGRMAIWLKIQSYEKDSMLYDTKGIHWYNYLFEKMHTELFDDFKQNQLSIITFNYDRSLEHYFFNKLMTRWGKRDPGECKEMLSNIPIIHVYGKLAPLPWQDSPGIPYDLDLDKIGYDAHVYISKAYEQIKIMSDDETDSEEFDEAFWTLEKGDRIFFLGFGYNKRNLTRLKLNKVTTNDINGTAYRWGFSEIKEISDDWSIIIPNNTRNLLEFLRNEKNLCQKKTV